jgi:hypothetical protein
MAALHAPNGQRNAECQRVELTMTNNLLCSFCSVLFHIVSSFLHEILGRCNHVSSLAGTKGYCVSHHTHLKRNLCDNSGGAGSLVGNPFDVLKTMAQANTGKSDSLGKVVGDFYAANGLGGFFRGISANIMRACVLNATKMGVYDIVSFKHTMRRKVETTRNSTGWSNTGALQVSHNDLVFGSGLCLYRPKAR